MTADALPIADLMSMSNAHAEAVSPDGALLAYLSNASGLPQIWLRSLAGGAPWPLTDMPDRVGKIAFSPVSRDLIFTVDCGGDERHQIWLIPEASGAPRALTTDPTTVHAWGAWSPDGKRIAYTANARRRDVMDVLVLDIATGTSRIVAEWPGFAEVLCFASDGAGLVVRDSRRATMDQDLWHIAIESGAAKKLLAHTGRWQFSSVRTRKGGQGLFVLCDADGAFHALYKTDADMQALEPLAAWEGMDIEAFALSPDHTRLACAVNQAGFSRLFTGPIDDPKAKEVPLPFRGCIGSMRFAPDGEKLLMSLEGPVTPSDVWSLDVATGEMTQITDEPKAGICTRSLVEPELMDIPGHDGVAIPAFVYRPDVPKPAAGYPLLFMVHGGPESQWRGTFRADLHHYLARGIMVVAPNVRGSTGYGRAFHELDDKEKRMDAVADLCALREAVAGWPEVDGERIGVMGQSYGGFMVLAAMCHRPDYWKAGVDLYGVANFITLMQTTGPWRRTLRAAEYGDPADMGGFLADISPVNRLDALTAPLLLVHAYEDPRVPMEQSEQVFSILRGLGRPVEIIRIPGEGHGFARRDNRVGVFSKIADFLERTI